MSDVTDVKSVPIVSEEAPITSPLWLNITSVLQVSWRPLGGLACLLAIATAVIMDPDEAKMWVAAAVAGVGIIGRSSEKITALKS